MYFSSFTKSLAIFNSLSFHPVSAFNWLVKLAIVSDVHVSLDLVFLWNISDLLDCVPLLFGLKSGSGDLDSEIEAGFRLAVSVITLDPVVKVEFFFPFLVVAWDGENPTFDEVFGIVKLG